MHELSIAESIISYLEKIMIKEGYDVINSVKIEIGFLAGVEIEALRFALDSIKKDTSFPETVFNLSSSAIKILCNDCDKETTVEDYTFQCAHCSGSNVEMTSGDTLEITELEVEP